MDVYIKHNYIYVIVDNLEVFSKYALYIYIVFDLLTHLTSP